MLLVRHLDDLPKTLKGGVAAIGNFDGIHKGHQAIIHHTVMVARDLKKPSLVVTFEPHPRTYFHPEQPNFRLTPLRSKAHQLELLGIDGLVVLHFDKDLAETSAEDFVEKILVEKLNVSHVVTGEDFCFGKNRQGTPKFLQKQASLQHFGLTQLPIVDDGEGEYSSTRVRQYLQDGRPAVAAKILGRPWSVEGRIAHGAKRGQSIGFPTANITIHDYLSPKLGVYAVRMKIEDGDWQDGVANYGVRPTVDGKTLMLEVHLFDFDGDLYEKHAQVDFIDFIRPEQKFDSLDDLKKQIALDCETAKQRLSHD